jgi:YfiR/HmsC-like
MGVLRRPLTPTRGTPSRPGGRGRPWPLWLPTLAVLLVPGSRAWAQAVHAPEYQVKAVFLFNFAQFVEWPPQAFSDSTEPIVIGVLGNDPFGDYLDETVRGETVSGRPFQVRHFRSVDEVRNCQILFIGSDNRSQMDKILAALKGRAILTVGEDDDFLKQGGVIRFLTERNRVRLRINLDAARLAGLTISSKLLKAAEVVEQRRG